MGRGQEYLDLTMVDFPRVRDLTPEMIEEGWIFSVDFLRDYLGYLSRFHQLTPPDAVHPGVGVLATELVGNWLAVLDSIRESHSKKNSAISPKVGPHLNIAQRLELEGAVLLTGKLEGTGGHMAAVEYLATYAPVILGVEPWEYYMWEKKVINPAARGAPLIPDQVRISLWAHHPFVSAVFMVPEVWHSSEEKRNKFCDNLFTETGAVYSCATQGFPYFQEKLNRGKKPKGKDWRIIPRFDLSSATKITQLV